MEIVGKDCREIIGIRHLDLSVAERKAIRAAQVRAKQIAEIWMDYHFHGVNFPEAKLGYLHRRFGEEWQTFHFYGFNWDLAEEFAEPPFRSYRADIVDQMLAFLVHAKRKQRLDKGRRPWAYDGEAVIGLGFPIRTNNKKRRVLSLDVDYRAIKLVKNKWRNQRQPDWRDPLAKPFLLIHDPVYGTVADQFAADVKGRDRDAELLRELGALVVPGDTGFQAQFYFKPGEHYGRRVLRPLVEDLNRLLYGHVDETNVGSLRCDGRWANGLPNSLPLPQDRRHLAAFIIDPLIDQFYRGEFQVSLEDLVAQVEHRLEGIGRLKPPPTTGGGSSPASLNATPAAPLLAAPTVGDSLSQPLDPPLASPTGDDAVYKVNCSDHDGIHTPTEDTATTPVRPATAGQELSKLFLDRLDGILDREVEQQPEAVAWTISQSAFPTKRLDPRGLIWSFIYTKDGRLQVPSNVSLGTIPDGQTNDWLKRGLAHFHSRDEFERAIAGQGEVADKLRRYDWVEKDGHGTEPERFGISWISDEFFAEVWKTVMAIKPLAATLNSVNRARAIEKLRHQFVLACHGLLNARRSIHGEIVMPVEGSRALLVGDVANTTSFDNRYLAPIKEALFERICYAWIDGWKRQTTPIAVFAPNCTGQALCDLLPEPSARKQLSYRTHDMQRRPTDVSNGLPPGADPERARARMDAWLGRKRKSGEPAGAS